MEPNENYEKILNFFYDFPDISEDLRKRFEDWMLANESSVNLQEALLDLWNREYGRIDNPVSSDSLARLLTTVETYEDSGRINKRRSKWKSFFKYAASILVVIISSLITLLYFSKHAAPKETILLTAKGSVGEFTLPDGSVVMLNGDSRLSFIEEGFGKNGKRTVNIQGEAFFDVSRDPEHPFVVKMSKMEVEVLGTSFDVRNYPFSSTEEVVLLSGSVKVATNENGVHTLRPDQRFVYDRAGGECEIENSDASKYCRWYESRLKLESETLEDLMVIIGRKYCLDINIDPDIDLSTKVSITLQNEPIEELMPILSYLTGIKWNLADSTLSITK